MSSNFSRFQTVALEIADAKSFEDVEFCSKGAFKETFRVRTDHDTTRALKILDPAKCNLARSSREVDAMQRCNLNAIGKLFEFDSFLDSKGRRYLYMLEEFFDGGTLTERMSGLLEVEIVKSYGHTLAAALRHLSELDLVHRDIKPDNIMFRMGADEPVLVDFGLVRDLSASSLTQTWLAMGPGTPLFASPEQLNNKKFQIGWRSDQFSLAIVLGICLTGNHPFATMGRTDADIVASVASYSRCADEFKNDAAAKGLANLVRMLEPWPVYRFSSADELIRSFEV